MNRQLQLLNLLINIIAFLLTIYVFSKRSNKKRDELKSKDLPLFDDISDSIG